jgi:hypothetical protein
VFDYLDHNEPGVAFEHLLYMIIEPEFVLTAAQLSVLAVGTHSPDRIYR